MNAANKANQYLYQAKSQDRREPKNNSYLTSHSEYKRDFNKETFRVNIGQVTTLSTLRKGTISILRQKIAGTSLMMDNYKDKGTLQTLAMTQMIKSTNAMKNHGEKLDINNQLTFKAP